MYATHTNDTTSQDVAPCHPIEAPMGTDKMIINIHPLNFQVVIGSKGRLSAIGGDSGYSSNLSHYCGGGGGGGVIQVFSSADIKDYTANSSIHTCGGRGIQDGEEGLEQVAREYIV